MSRSSVVPELLTKLSSAVTAPGYLLQIDLSTTYRFSSRSTVTWDGNTWVGTTFAVNLSEDQSSTRLTVKFMNHDNAIGTLMLTDGIANRVVKLWSFTGDSPASSDAVQVFAGVGDSCQIDRRSVTIDCAPVGQEVVKVPWVRIVRNSTRQILIDPGTRIAWGNEVYELTSR